jgi:hypothetical protein
MEEFGFLVMTNTWTIGRSPDVTRKSMSFSWHLSMQRGYQSIRAICSSPFEIIRKIWVRSANMQSWIDAAVIALIDCSRYAAEQ